MIVCNAEIFRGGSCLRLGLFRLAGVQRLDDNIIGQAVFIAGVQHGGPRRGGSLRDLLFGGLRGEQTGVALIMAHSVLKEIAGNSLVAPGIGAGVNADIYLSNVADCAVDLVIAKGKGHFVAHLIGQLPLQGHRLPLGRLMGEAVQLLLIHRSEDGRDSLPGQGQLCAEFVLNFHRHAGGGGKVVRDVSGLQRHRLGAAGKGFG